MSESERGKGTGLLAAALVGEQSKLKSCFQEFEGEGSHEKYGPFPSRQSITLCKFHFTARETGAQVLAQGSRRRGLS